MNQPYEHRNLRITILTFLAFYLNGAIDSGMRPSISCDRVQDEIEAGTIFTFLQAQLGRDIDLSILDDDKRAALLAEWQDMAAAINARRKFGVEKNGLCLLVAYLLEGIQRRQDNNPAA